MRNGNLNSSFIILVIVFLGISLSRADFLPKDPSPRDFRSVTDKSPFTRSLNMPSTLILTGVADLLGENVAILIDAETGGSTIISSKENDKGWKLVSVANPGELNKAVATISRGDGNNFRVAYDRKQHEAVMKKFKKAKPKTTSEGKSSISDSSKLTDQQRKEQYAKLKSAWSKMSKEQQDAAKKKLSEAFRANPNMSREERTKTYSRVMSEATGSNRR